VLDKRKCLTKRIEGALTKVIRYKIVMITIRNNTTKENPQQAIGLAMG